MIQISKLKTFTQKSLSDQVLYLQFAHVSGERLQDHWSSGYVTKTSLGMQTVSQLSRASMKKILVENGYLFVGFLKQGRKSEFSYTFL